ncbi:hypothetical protein G3545_14050 [Starkeya sp. ORNL1]|uniref:hypothetical protein n=1 Tax=Starkeya sp. ORNL1 TaxID=2709380 RepID=UPI001462B1D2|nr:hypothetical protein [Starkeya sp. ORNL1]QJP14666.1 hypothetical protein G3545_14050 [Starkeya sp. ORNL1]
MKFFHIPPPPPLSTIAAVGANTVSSGTSIDFPSGILPGDILWLQAGVAAFDPMHSTGPDGIAATPADGFVLVYDEPPAEGQVDRVIFQAKIADGSENEVGSVVISSQSGHHSLMQIFRGDFPAVGFTLFDGNQTPSTGDPSAQTIDVTGAIFGKPALLAGIALGTTGAPTISGTLASGGVAFTAPASIYKSSYQIQNGSKASRTWDMNDAGFNTLWSTGVSVF